MNIKSTTASLIFVILLSACIKNQNPEQQIIGKHKLNVQFISDVPGHITVIKTNDSLLMNGETWSNDSSASMRINGYLTNIFPDSFTFTGNIKITSMGCCGNIDKNNIWTFRKMEERFFYRLKERDSLCSCDTCCYYVDITPINQN